MASRTSDGDTQPSHTLQTSYNKINSIYAKTAILAVIKEEDIDTMIMKLGTHWYQRFPKRHEDKIAYRWCVGLNELRHKNMKLEYMIQYFDLLSQIIQEKNIAPWNIFNMDETGCQLHPQRCKSKSEDWLLAKIWRQGRDNLNH